MPNTTNFWMSEAFLDAYKRAEKKLRENLTVAPVWMMSWEEAERRYPNLDCPLDGAAGRTV